MATSSSASPTEQLKSDFRDKLKKVNGEKSILILKVEELEHKLREKHLRILQLTRKVSDLERKVEQLHPFVGGNDDDQNDEVVRQVKRVGPRQKMWEELGPQQKRKQSQKLFDELKKVSETRGVEPVRMVGNLLHRYNFVWVYC